MTASELAQQLASLAQSLEDSVPLATNRAEHVRVTAHALTARALEREAIGLALLEAALAPVS